MNSPFEVSALDVDHCGDTVDSTLASSRFVGGASPRVARETGNDRALSTGRSNLLRMIEGEIIPRLFLVHQSPEPLRRSGSAFDEYEDVLGDRKSFARLFLVGQTDQILRLLQSVLDQGVSVEEVYVSVLSRVADDLPSLLQDESCSLNSFLQGVFCLNSVRAELHGGLTFLSNARNSIEGIDARE